MVERNQRKKYDVVVVGGGMSGVCAAIASARSGAKTAIIQARSMYGGNASSEIRMHIVGASCHLAKPYAAETGILHEILLENKWRNPAHIFPVWDTVIWEKVHFQENLDSYLNTTMNSLVVEDDEIKEIHCYQQTTEISFVFEAPIFIDATGNGTLGFYAGAEYRIGSEGKDELNEPNAPDEPNKFTMGNTIMFQARDVGKPVEFRKPFWAKTLTEEDLALRKHVNTTTAMADMFSDTEFKEGEMKALPEFSRLDSGYWWIELGGDYDDIIGEGEEIRDELLSYVYGVWDHIKNAGDHGAANYELEWVGITPGYRESRRLIGHYLLNEHDVRANKVFEDAVAYGGWPMDEHVPGGIKDTHRYPARILNFDGLYTIPLRSFINKDISNLMMTGRAISCSKMAFGSTRVMGTCAIGGQAAGTAAALAIEKGIKPIDVLKHTKELQQQLLKDDLYIPGLIVAIEDDLLVDATVESSSHLKGYEAELVRNGVTRENENGSNMWKSEELSKGDQWLRFKLAQGKKVTEVRCTFDSNLDKEIMPSITATVRDRQPADVPPELVKDFEVVLTNKGKNVWSKKVKDNHQRLVSVEVPEAVVADTLEIKVLATNGHPHAHVFEVRAY